LFARNEARGLTYLTTVDALEARSLPVDVSGWLALASPLCLAEPSGLVA
jgi:hypothetical protein